LDYAAAGVRAAHERGGRVLVLATSYGDAEAIVRRVEGGILHKRGQKLDGVLDAFRADPAAVLVSPAAWAGVSLPGLISHLVIPRIPFPARDEARDVVMVRALMERGLTEGHARAVLHAQARIDAKRKLRQGIGRAIRLASDQAVLWLLDPRFPLPDPLVRNPRLRLHQGAASRYRDLVQCIPARFRTGASPAFDRAEIFPWRSAAEAAA
jgi:Rad3-related DNA helicase